MSSYGCRYPDLASGGGAGSKSNYAWDDGKEMQASAGPFVSKKAVMLGMVFVLALAMILGVCITMVLPGCARRVGGGRVRNKGGVKRVKERGFEIEEEGLMLGGWDEDNVGVGVGGGGGGGVVVEDRDPFS